MTHRSALGDLGERLATLILASHGVEIISRNVRVGRGEIDLVAMDGAERVAVEVRTRTGGLDPVDAVDPAKRRKVKALARRIGATRMDVVGLGLGEKGIDFHWVPGAT